MSYSTNAKGENTYKLFLFSFLLAVLTYGFALTNFTLSVDNEIPIFADFGLDVGRWGQNLIRYHLFKGHLQYFSLVLSLFLFSMSAVRLTRLFKFQNLSAFFFCALFVTFPQISYQVVFGMMADIAGLGILLSIYSIELFEKGFNTKPLAKKILFFSSGVLIAVFTFSLYQAFIIVLTSLCVILFFQSTFEESFKLNSGIKKILLKGGLLLVSLLLYYISVKIICPPMESSGYLSSFVSENTNNQFFDFCSIWLKNLVGSFYFGERMFIIVLLLSIFLFIYFVLNKKFVLIRFLSLFSLLLLPFIMSSVITNGYHPPRLYVASSLVFAFVIVFTISHFKISPSNLIKVAVVLISISNFYFVTKLFYTANKIYKHDRRMAEKIDNTIQTKYPSFSTSEKYIYFYGYLPFEFHQKFRLDKSEIFGGSVYNWDNGNNYRMINFFKEADIAEYTMITKEKFVIVKDSIAKMPIWPNPESVKMIDNTIIIKLGNEKGSPLYFE